MYVPTCCDAGADADGAEQVAQTVRALRGLIQETVGCEEGARAEAVLREAAPYADSLGQPWQALSFRAQPTAPPQHTRHARPCNQGY
jgi:hypothetical protein